jgi:hypothetical protein
MKRQYTFEDRLSEWLEEGPVDAPDAVAKTVLAAFPSIPQRRGVLRVPWRFPLMNGYARALAGIAAIAVVAVLALTLINRPQTAVIGGPGSPSPSPSPAPSPSAAPTPSPTPINPATWKTFTSARHGETMRYPSDWTATAATAPWPVGSDAPTPPNPMLDAFTAPGGNGSAFVVVSQPTNGVPDASWLATYEQTGAAKFPPACWPSADKMEQRMLIGGLPAYIHGGIYGCAFTEAIAFSGGRVWELTAYADPSTLTNAVFDRALFDAFLSAVTLDRTKVNDLPVRAVSPQPSSPAPS